MNPYCNPTLQIVDSIQMAAIIIHFCFFVKPGKAGYKVSGGDVGE